MTKQIIIILLSICSVSVSAQDLEPERGPNDYYGYKDSKGNLVIPYKYTHAGKFSDGMAAVRFNKKSGFINKDDKAVIPFTYEDVEGFYEDLAAVKINEKWGFINRSGKEVIAAVYEKVNNFREGMAAVAPVRRAGWGYINKEGKLVIPVQYKSVNYFSDGVALVGNDEGYFHIDKTGKLLDKKNKINTSATESASVVVQNANGVRAMPGKKTNAEIEDACKAASEKMKYPASANAAVKVLRRYDATGNMPVASYYLAQGFAAGQVNPPKKEIDSAMYYCQKAVQKGFQPAMYFFGQLYQYATGADFPMPTDRNRYAYLIDKKKARYWYNESAKTGNIWASQKVTLLDKAAADAELKDAYSNGYTAFTDKNFEEAYRWWKLSAFEGNDADAYYGLAVLHHLGKAPGSDYNKAIEYYQKAADLGKKEALTEKQKVLDYFAALEAARKKAVSTSGTVATKKGESYEEWWEKTYGRGGTQNSRPMPNYNTPQARYRPGSQSESDRHQSAMDQIYRDSEKQMRRGFKYN